ncbi:MAG: hypothetical protein QGH74_09555 [Candidatus Brocadiia bacterium]|jgi:hypothetical protein|nr:hypothetical protein [Candidatus Brocadiia bacterium]
MDAHLPEKKASSATKWLLGCGIGCGTLVAAVIVGIVLLVAWVKRAHPVPPPETFLTPTASSFAILQIRPDDEALIAMLEQQVENAPADVKRKIRSGGPTGQQVEQMRQNLETVTPIHVVVAVRPGSEEGEFLWSVAISIEGFSNPINLMLRSIVNDMPDSGGSLQAHKDVEIGVDQDGACIAPVDNNFLVGNDLEVVKDWIDRLQEFAGLQEAAAEGAEVVLPYEGPDDLKGMYERLEPSAQVRFASLNEHGEVEAFLEHILAERPEKEAQEIAEALLEAGVADAVAIAGGSMTLASAGAAEFRLLLEGRDEEGAMLCEESLTSIAEEKKLEGAETSREGALVEFRFTATDTALPQPPAEPAGSGTPGE